MDLNTILPQLTADDIADVNKLLASDEFRKEYSGKLKTADSFTQPVYERVLFVYGNLIKDAPDFLKLTQEIKEEDDSMGVMAFSAAGTPVPLPPQSTPTPSPTKPLSLVDGLSRYDKVFPAFSELDAFVNTFNAKYLGFIPFPELWHFRAGVQAMNNGNDVFLEWQKQQGVTLKEDDMDKRSKVLAGFFKSNSVEGIELAVEYGYMGWGDTPLVTDLLKADGGLEKSKGPAAKNFDDMNRLHQEQFAKAEKIKLTAAETLTQINKKEMFDVLLRHPEAKDHMGDFAKFSLATLAFDVYNEDIEAQQDLNPKLIEVVGIFGGLNSRDVISKVSFGSGLGYMLMNMRRNNAKILSTFIREFTSVHGNIENLKDEMGNDLLAQAFLGLINETKDEEDLNISIETIMALINNSVLDVTLIENKSNNTQLDLLNKTNHRRIQLFQTAVERQRSQIENAEKYIPEVETKILEAKTTEAKEKLIEILEETKQFIEKAKNDLNNMVFDMADIGLFNRLKQEVINTLMVKYGKYENTYTSSTTTVAPKNYTAQDLYGNNDKTPEEHVQDNMDMGFFPLM